MTGQNIESASYQTAAACFSLQGKVALVTGAGRGIGAGIAEVFAEAGATVVINALTGTYLARLVENLKSTHGGRIIGVVGDAATPDGARQVVNESVDSAGDIDILVNSVGDAISKGLVDESSGGTSPTAADRDIQKILDLNLHSAIHCTRAVGMTMIRRRRGRVINIAGVLGALKGHARLSVYAAGKAGLSGFTKSLAHEWAPYGITVNAIAPGVFPDKEHLSPEHYVAIENAYLKQIPLGRFGRFREVGQLALYIASDASNYLTGQVIALDGGLTA
jgi:NAD(P)-dependent dehydrogenase (short-subunit alcohol dehydrogenase family)